MKNIIKIFTSILFVLLLNGCYQPETVSNSQNQLSNKNKIIENENNDANEFIDSLILPTGFYVDSTLIYFKTQHLEVIQKSINTYNGDIKWTIDQINDSLKAEIDVFINDWNDILKEDPNFFKRNDSSFHNYLSIEPVLVNFDSSILSIVMQFYRYDYGAAHGNGYYRTFNFDLKTQKLIRFFDFFNFESRKDTFFLIEKIKNSNELVDLKKFWEYDFYIGKDFISFNFNNYDVCSYAEGMPKTFIRRDSLKRLIRKEYQSDN